MALYRFYDTDAAGTKTYDISGARYRQLLGTCFQYCTSVAMCVHQDVNADFLSIESFALPVTSRLRVQYGHYGSFAADDRNETKTYQLVHYVLEPEVKRFLLTRADGIFQWTYAWESENPDDLTFFRPDGSVFFSCRAREGVCTLSPAEDEDVSLILSDPRWIGE